jgi:hypothetical protein
MMKTGSCLCGAVAFEIHGPMQDMHACHCIQCRKQTGNYWMSSRMADADLKFTHDKGLKWFTSSSDAKRGFCVDCGSTLFYKRNGSDEISVCMGSLDGKTGLRLSGHIYCDFAGDYYTITGGDFQKGEW